MKTMGFPISHMENENRRALTPKHVLLIEHPENLYFEKNYGAAIGISDKEYTDAGANICTRAKTLSMDIICDPKIGNAEYLSVLKPGQTVFGWLHATQNREITDILLVNQLTAYAWEHMHEGARHVFWRNNELAGEAAVMHAYRCFGTMPYETKVAVIGRGNTARGAIKTLNMLGADVAQYDRRTEDLLRRELDEFDVIVNCVLWDITRKDHIISRDDLKRMKKNSMIIDVSCDKAGGIETSIPTTIEKPVYTVDGVVHYAVDHTPALFSKTFTNINSQILYPYINELIYDAPGKTLQDSLIIKDGVVIDEEINTYQNR